MKKTYTRKQIREAIAYWENILENMQGGNGDLSDLKSIIAKYNTVDKIIDFRETDVDLMPYIDFEKLIDTA